MFKSKRRPLVIPQSEHLRLVGTLAMLWGNAEFDPPPIERISMIAGMGLHDRGYGALDNALIGGMQAEEWNTIARHSFYLPSADVIVDTMIKYHVRRLAGRDESAERNALTAEFSHAIEAQLAQHNFSKGLFDHLDRIINLCDRVSFDFCMDVPDAGEVALFPRNADEMEVAVRYRVEEGVIHMTPWPLAVDRYEGYIIAYQVDGYPDRLEPIILTYRLERK